MKSNKLKNNINENVKLEKIYNIIGQLIICILLGILFGYAGYVFCKDNNYNLTKGITFGFLFPFILLKINDKYDFGFIIFVIFLVAWIALCSYIPTFVGIVAIFLIIIKYVLDIINLLKNKQNTITESHEQKNKLEYMDNNSFSSYYDDTNSDMNILEGSFYCERCFKKISEEEYEMNDCMCEDCYEDVVVNHQDDIF